MTKMDGFNKFNSLVDVAKRWFRRDGGDDHAVAGSCFVFGKHPLWADHMPLIGEAGAPAKRLGDHLYTCIQSALDNGVWRDIPNLDPKETFDHLVLFSQGPQSVVACMRSSEDSVGRRLYPLIVCAQASGRSFEKVVVPGVRLTQDLDGQLASCREIAEVKQAVADASSKWRRLVEAADGTSDASLNLQRLTEAETLGEAQVGLERIAYQLQTHAATFADMRSSEILAERARFLRLPRLGAGSALGDDMMLWAVFARRVLPASLPMHIFASRNGGWMDLAIGQITGQDLYCLQADEQSIPLTSTIPFEIPDGMAQTVAKLINP